MSKRKPTYFAIVVVLLLFFSTAAVFGGGETEAAAQDEQTTVAILLGDTPDWTLLEDNVAAFNADNPNITLDFTYLSHKEMVDKVSIELASGSATYDVVYIDNFGLPPWAAAGWLESQNSYIEESGMDLSDFGQGFIDALSYEGEIYSPPYYAETLVYYFRKDLFDEAGITEVPDTYEDMRQVAKVLHSDSVSGMVMRGDKFYGYVAYAYSGVLKAYGSDWFDEDWNVTFNNEAGVAAAEVWADMMRNTAPAGVATYGWQEALADFNQGRVAQFIDASPFGPRINDPSESTVKDIVGYSVALAGPERRAPGMYTAGHAINTYSKNKDAAWKFVEWSMSPTINKLVSNPSRFSTLELPEIVEKFSFGPDGYHFLDAWVEGLKYAESPFPSIPEWPEVGDRIGTALNRIILGADIEDELNAAAQDVEAIMTNAGY